MTQPWLDDLNDQQRRAVTFGDGPLLVIAGAGTGKTKTLACRVAYLIAKGVDPDRILLLTFTRRAAAEMISRANRLIDGDLAAHVCDRHRRRQRFYHHGSGRRRRPDEPDSR